MSARVSDARKPAAPKTRGAMKARDPSRRKMSRGALVICCPLGFRDLRSSVRGPGRAARGVGRAAAGAQRGEVAPRRGRIPGRRFTRRNTSGALSSSGAPRRGFTGLASVCRSPARFARHAGPLRGRPGEASYDRPGESPVPRTRYSEASRGFRGSRRRGLSRNAATVLGEAPILGASPSGWSFPDTQAGRAPPGDPFYPRPLAPGGGTKGWPLRG